MPTRRSAEACANTLTHFIKSVEDIHEALVGAVPGIKFGLAFCEASGKCLVRCSGTDTAMVQLAEKNASALGAGHCFIVFLGEGYYPVNVLNAIKMVPEVCRIFCATANPVEVVVAETDQGRGVLGVIDGFPPKGVLDDVLSLDAHGDHRGKVDRGNKTGALQSGLHVDRIRANVGKGGEVLASGSTPDRPKRHGNGPPVKFSRRHGE